LLIGQKVAGRDPSAGMPIYLVSNKQSWPTSFLINSGFINFPP
jgi:hypothetical protein